MKNPVKTDFPNRTGGPLDPDFDLDDYVIYNLARAVATYNEVMATALKKYRLDTTKWRILMLLDKKSPQSVSELGQGAVTRMPTLTKMLHRMEKEGLIKRRTLSEDRRVVQVSMTENAAENLAMVRKIGHRVFEMAFDGISDADAKKMTRLLKKMRHNLERSPFEM